jgi:hypothetical protein
MKRKEKKESKSEIFSACFCIAAACGAQPELVPDSLQHWRYCLRQTRLDRQLFTVIFSWCWSDNSKSDQEDLPWSSVLFLQQNESGTSLIINV